MVVFYIIGIVCTGIAILSAVASIFFDGRLSACINWLIDLVSLLPWAIMATVTNICQ